MKLTPRGRFVVGTLVVVALWAWIIGSYTIGAAWTQDRLDRENAGTIPPVSITCQEDDPTCWNCETMGNGICGPGK
jgi:hypothetical protein